MEEHGRYLFRSEPTPPDIRSAESVEDEDLRYVLGHWRGLKGVRAMPARSQIAPRDLKRCLRTVHIYDVIGNGADFRARLVGTGVYPGLDEDQTGKLISEHPDPGVRLRFTLVMRHVVETVEPARSVAFRRTGSLLHDMRTEGLWLPLGRSGRVEHVLAVSALKSPV
jgi:PAS domain